LECGHDRLEQWEGGQRTPRGYGGNSAKADNGDRNLGYKTFVNGVLVSNIVIVIVIVIVIDSSTAATDTIDYVAADNAGNTATTTTRTIIIAAASAKADPAGTATSSPVQ
jgi:hypothetical protein